MTNTLYNLVETIHTAYSREFMEHHHALQDDADAMETGCIYPQNVVLYLESNPQVIRNLLHLS